MNLILKELCLSHGQKTIVGPLDLCQDATRSLAIIGPSGSGKTSLAKAILGIGSFSTKGSIYFDNQLLQNNAAHIIAINKRKFGYIPQGLSSWPHLKVKDAVYLACKLSKNSAAYVNVLVQSLGLAPFIEHIPCQLSFGQKARLAIACALAARPRLLIMDEALSSLDIVNKMSIINLIKEHQKQHAFALIFISHDLAESIHLSDDILLIENGLKLWHGAKEDLAHAPFSKEWNPLLSPLLNLSLA